MSDLTFTPEFENQIRDAMVVPDPSPAFLNDLRQQLVAQAEKRSHPVRSASSSARPCAGG